jgi:hypothetical protein
MSSSVRMQVRQNYTVYKGSLNNSQVISLEKILGENGREAVQKVLNADSDWNQDANNATSYHKIIAKSALPGELQNIGVRQLEIQMSLKGGSSHIITRAQFETRQQVDATIIQEQGAKVLQSITNQAVNQVLAQSLVERIQQQVEQLQQRQKVEVSVESGVNHRIIARLNHGGGSYGN